MAEDKKNFCDKDGQCTAQCQEDTEACKYFYREEVMRPGLCVHLSKLGDTCMSPDALTAKWKELQRDNATAEAGR